MVIAVHVRQRVVQVAVARPTNALEVNAEKKKAFKLYLD